MACNHLVGSSSALLFLDPRAASTLPAIKRTSPLFASLSPPPSLAFTPPPPPPPLSSPSVVREGEEEEEREQDDDGEKEDEGEATEADMLAFLQARKTEDAWRCFDLLSGRGRIPNSVCVSRLVAQLSHRGTLSSLTRAQRVLVFLQRRNMTALLDCNALGLLAMATAKAGASRYAASIIQLMLKLSLSPHVKAWSSVISRLGKHKEDIPLALNIFEQICQRVREADETREGHQVDQTMRPDTAAFNAIINACANAGLVEKADGFFDELGAFGLQPDILTFNILIKLYGLSGNTGQLCVILDRMQSARLKPSLHTMNSLVAAFVGLDDMETAVMVVKALKEGNEDVNSILKRKRDASDSHGPLEDSITKSSVQDSCFLGAVNLVAAGGFEEQSSASKLSLKPDTRMYTTLMKGFMRKGRIQEVKQMLVAMQNQPDTNCQPNEVTYTTVISTYVRLGLLDEARTILNEMITQNIPVNVVTYNVLLNGYSKALEIPKARLLMEDMKKAGIQPDAVSYNTLIDGYISMDESASALAMFTEMRDAGIAPTKISYTTLIKAFGLNGQPHLASKVFQEMEQDPRMTVDVIACNALIESYSKVGQAGGAKESLEKLRMHGHLPTVATYGSLVKAFATAGKSGEILVLWNEIKERLEVEEEKGGTRFLPDGGLLDGLVDVCVRAGFFQKALEILACMEKYQIPADKIKYKRIFVEHHSRIYTSKHASQARRDRNAGRKRAVEAFKFWVGLPNDYYESDWSL